MKISYRWLLELTGIDWPVQTVADRLTLCGLACEEVTPTGTHLGGVVVGKVMELSSVEGASKIRKAIVDVGSERLQVICGAPNVAVGMKVPVALVGARLAGGMQIEKVTIRGVESSGMICSESELGISSDRSGIMVLDAGARTGAPLIEHLEFDDYILGFELTPNRGDAMSAIGIARDLAALAGVRVKRPEITLKESSERTDSLVRVRIEDPLGCPRYAARVIKDVTVGPSPWWFQKKLITAGIRPISNVVDITNMIMLESGNPLHAFDLERFGSSEVVVRRARHGEKFVTLDEKEHVLSEGILLITNGKVGVAAAGIMGGVDSGISQETKTILLEAAFFDPMTIRRGRREMGVITESSARFERGVDPNGIPYALDRAARLFQEVCGGEVLGGVAESYPGRKTPMAVTMRPSRCNRIIGTSIPTEKMRAIFGSLEFSVSGNDPLQVTVPTFRSDISSEIDLIEEVVRITGFEAVPDAVGNLGPLHTPIHRRDHVEAKIRRILTGVGFDEIKGHGFADSRTARVLNPDLSQVRITNPVSDELDIMRNSLIQTALTVAGHNIAHRNIDLRLFEIGRVYLPPVEGAEWKEEDRLSILVTGSTEATWRDKPRTQDFYDLKCAIEATITHFRCDELVLLPKLVPYLDPRVSFEVHAGETLLGFSGKVLPEIARRFDIKQELFISELSIDAIENSGRELIGFEPLPVYPAAPRDIAVLIDESIPVGELVRNIRETAGALAEAVSIFDLYSGKQVQKGKKSVGISITYRSPDRSLSSGEVDAVQVDIVAMVKSKFMAEIRDK